MKLFHLIWVLGLAGMISACNSGEAIQGCSELGQEYDEGTGSCATPGTGGGNGTGGTGGGGGGDGACTNDADTAVYDALEYSPNAETTLTGPEAASQIASDCVFGNQNATPSNPGCGAEAQAVLICGGSGCPTETINALTQCVVDCQQGLIETITGSTLSSECNACYGESVTCSAVNCATAGCTVPTSPGCVACRCQNDCTPGFDRCSGLPSSGDCG
jgi:hypothetical protein